MNGKKDSFADIQDPLIIADLLSETVGGGSNTVTAMGNGSLSAGVSPWGELVYLRWPAPSYYDHLRYVTRAYGVIYGMFRVRDVRYGSDAPCGDWNKYGRPYEKYPHLGARAGLMTERGGTAWMDDPLWVSGRSYDPEGSHILSTTLEGEQDTGAEGIQLTAEQWIMPDRDLLVQQFSSSTLSLDSFFYHATFAPWMNIPASLGNNDSKRAGFACVFCPEEEVLVWFYPKRRKDRVVIKRNIRSIRSTVELDRFCPGGGIFIAMGAVEPLKSFQVGADRAGRSHGAPLGGRADTQDGKLQENRFHIGHVDAALQFDISPRDTITLLTSLSDTALEAGRILDRSRNAGAANLRETSIRLWDGERTSIHMPAGLKERDKRVGLRSMQNLLAGRDARTGAFVASLTRQPFYACDWPRDGAFYDLALDLAGLSDKVHDHLLFYRRNQRKKRLAFSPAWLINFRSPFYNPRGHWHSNMNTDGTPGFFNVIPIEIDETSLMVWDIWRHEQYVPDHEKARYRDDFRETVTWAMEGILPFLDRKKGWTKKIFEDDNPWITATLHGASAVLTALAAGSDLARKWGFSSEKESSWGEAASILRKGMLERIRDPKTLSDAGWRGIQWSLFPAPLFENYESDDCRPFLDILIEDMVNKVIHKKGGVGYLGEQLFMFAFSTRGRDRDTLPGKVPEGEMRFGEFKEKVLDLLTGEVPVEGTDCYGELGLWKNVDGKDIIQNRTSIPHLWNGVTLYLALVALYEPERLESLRPPVPALR